MKKRKKIGLDFKVDQLTNSIVNVISGDNFPTDVSIVTVDDLKTTTKKSGWKFDWRIEFRHPERDVYKLTIVNNPTVIQGLVCLEIRPDNVFMHLIESAPL